MKALLTVTLLALAQGAFSQSFQIGASAGYAIQQRTEPYSPNQGLNMVVTGGWKSRSILFRLGYQLQKLSKKSEIETNYSTTAHKGFIGLGFDLKRNPDFSLGFGIGISSQQEELDSFGKMVTAYYDPVLSPSINLLYNKGLSAIIALHLELTCFYNHYLGDLGADEFNVSGFGAFFNVGIIFSILRSTHN